MIETNSIRSTLPKLSVNLFCTAHNMDRVYVMRTGDMLHRNNKSLITAKVGPMNGQRLGIAVHEDLVITSITEGSPADVAGLKTGHRIDSVGDKRISHPTELNKILTESSPDEVLTMLLLPNTFRNDNPSQPQQNYITPVILSQIFSQGQLEGSTRASIQFEEYSSWRDLQSHLVIE